MKDKELILLLTTGGAPSEQKWMQRVYACSCSIAASLGSRALPTQDRVEWWQLSGSSPSLTAEHLGLGCHLLRKWLSQKTPSPPWTHPKDSPQPSSFQGSAEPAHLSEEQDFWFAQFPHSFLHLRFLMYVWPSSFIYLPAWPFLLSADIHSSDLLPWASFNLHLQHLTSHLHFDNLQGATHNFLPQISYSCINLTINNRISSQDQLPYFSHFHIQSGPILSPKGSRSLFFLSMSMTTDCSGPSRLPVEPESFQTALPLTHLPSTATRLNFIKHRDGSSRAPTQLP